MEEKVFNALGEYAFEDAVGFPFVDLTREIWGLPRGPGSGPEIPKKRRPGLFW